MTQDMKSAHLGLKSHIIIADLVKTNGSGTQTTITSSNGHWTACNEIQGELFGISCMR